MKLRPVLILATMLLGGMLLSGVALAANKVSCTANNNPCQGSNSQDRIKGDANRNDIYGNGGKDDIKGNKGEDQIHGGPRPDRLWGGDGADNIDGDDGHDVAYGGDGKDEIRSATPHYGPQGLEILGAAKDDHNRKPGGLKPDKPDASRRADKVFGGDDADTIITDNGQKDVINCGPGGDKAIIDQFDTRANCEAVTVDRTPRPPSSPPDTTPPVVSIDDNLDAGSADSDGRVTFWFSANEDSAFYCQLTDKTRSLSPEFTLCGSAPTYGKKSYPESQQGSPLDPGDYRFEVYAVDQAALASKVVSINFSVLMP